MPPGVSGTFTSLQIQFIETALVPRTHAVDLRLSLPLFGKGAYLVLAVGPNRRAGDRNRQIATMPTVSACAISLSQSFPRCPNAGRLLQRLPTEISTTFTLPQIQAIETALMPRAHAINVQQQLPFFGKGAYLVFAAGPNRRARYHSNLRNRNAWVIPIVSVSAAVSTLGILGLVTLKGTQLLAKPDPSFTTEKAFYPAIVPFKKDRQECEKSLRQWIDDKCIDSDHDPTF